MNRFEQRVFVFPPRRLPETAERCRRPNRPPCFVAQAIGALIGAVIVLALASGRPGYSLSSDGLGTNGFADSSPGAYDLASVAVFEIIATATLVLVVLATTARSAHPALAAGIPIGLTLTALLVAAPYAVGEGRAEDVAYDVGYRAGQITADVLLAAVVLGVVLGGAVLVRRALRRRAGGRAG